MAEAGNYQPTEEMVRAKLARRKPGRRFGPLFASDEVAVLIATLDRERQRAERAEFAARTNLDECQRQYERANDAWGEVTRLRRELEEARAVWTELLGHLLYAPPTLCRGCLADEPCYYIPSCVTRDKNYQSALRLARAREGKT